MRSRHLIDPELLPLLEMFPSVPLDAASLPAMRETMKAMIPPALAEDRGVTLEEIWLPAGADGHKVRALVYRPANHADRTVTGNERDPHPFAGEYLWHQANNRFGWTALLVQAPGSPCVSPYASPARAEDLAGLPPTFISTGALDLFVEEDMEYARRLIRAGVPTELHVYAGAPHGFSALPGARVGQAHARDLDGALRRMFG
ncbi:MAG: alpha/beta hydrolase fold domain-containing protein [Pseudomonadota bacterium]|nr:alpha/beta hydrolase fold domain-containing protein [Pseudomonadota bacterium]